MPVLQKVINSATETITIPSIEKYAQKNCRWETVPLTISK